MKQPVVIAIDRSMLASNMYRLLFAPLGAAVITASSLDELRERLSRSRDIDLMVMSSNVLSGSFERIVELLKGSERLSDVPKVFLCKESELAKGWDAELSILPHTEVIERPFHPDEFVTRVKRILAIEE